MLVTEGHVGVYEVADRLHPRPAKRRRSEQAPRLVGKPIRLTVAASKQEQQGVRRQVLDLVLQGVQLGRLRRARITNDRIRAETEAAGGCNEAAAPVSETIAIALDRNRGRGHQVVRTLQVGEARKMHVQCHDHRCGLWKLEAELTADMDTHAGCFRRIRSLLRCNGRAGSHSVHQAPRGLICSLGGQFYTDLIAKGAHVCFDRNACSKRPAL